MDEDIYIFSLNSLSVHSTWFSSSLVIIYSILKFTHFPLALTNLFSSTDSNYFLSGMYILHIGILIFILTAIN